jgi:uncharacterized repeat protein (TIGR04076 family)
VYKCKITVLKRMVNQDLADEYLKSAESAGPCARFQDGQEFVLEGPFAVPENFCPWAWADIRKDILMIVTGGDPSWIKRPGTLITGCTDWFKPVIFKVERMD